MVKIVALFCVLSTNFLANTQVDTIKCEESFTHLDTLLGENLIVIWETPPSLKECSQKDLVMLEEFARNQINYEYIFIDMIIDSEGVPICFRFKQEIEQINRVKITDKLKLLRFNPALIQDKRLESIYTIKI